MMRARRLRVACFEGDLPEAVGDDAQSDHVAAFAGGVGGVQVKGARPFPVASLESHIGENGQRLRDHPSVSAGASELE